MAEQDFVNSFETVCGNAIDTMNRRWRWILALVVLLGLAWLAVDIVVWEGGIRISRDGERVGIIQRVSPSKGFIWTAFEFELAQYAGAGSHQGKKGQAELFGPWVCNVAAGDKEVKDAIMKYEGVPVKITYDEYWFKGFIYTTNYHAKRVVPLE